MIWKIYPSTADAPIIARFSKPTSRVLEFGERWTERLNRKRERSLVSDLRRFFLFVPPPKLFSFESYATDFDFKRMYFVFVFDENLGSVNGVCVVNQRDDCFYTHRLFFIY
jgi:hypothetical protein